MIELSCIEIGAKLIEVDNSKPLQELESIMSSNDQTLCFALDKTNRMSRRELELSILKE